MNIFKMPAKQSHDAVGGVKSAKMTAKIIRADGTEYELGVVAYHHKNPIKRWAFNAYNRIRLALEIKRINKGAMK